MTNEVSVEEAIDVFKIMKRQVLEDSREDKVLDMAIKALEQQPITWIVGKDNCQVAVRNMPIDKMQKICAIIGDEEQQPKTGHWIDEGQYAEGHSHHAYECSECGNHIIELKPDDFCKFCGADMREGEE